MFSKMTAQAQTLISQKHQHSMKSIFHKLVVNAVTAPNSPRYTKLDKYKETNQNRNWSEICVKLDFVVFAVLLGAKTNWA